MVDDPRRQALFAGLLSNERGDSVDVTYVGGEAFYVIPDGDFRRHVEALYVDRQVLQVLRDQITDNQDAIVRGVLDFLGKDDLFTKISIDMALKNFEEGFRQADPEQWKPWLGLLGFRVVIDVHGDVIEVDLPHQEVDEG